MNDSGFLSDLARTAREEEAEERQRWDRWDRLNDGALSPEEEAELKALATGSVEDEMAFEAFRPLDSDFRARMVTKIGPLVMPPVEPPVEPSFWVKWLRAVREEISRWLTLLGPDRSASGWDGLSNGASPAMASTFPWRRVGFISSGVAATALFLIMIYWPRPPKPESTEAALDFDVERPVPGETEKRGDEGTTILAAGGTFDTSAAPATPHSVEVEPRCYVKPKVPPTLLRKADCVASDRKNNGSMKIHGSLPKDLPAGPATLLIVLAASGNQPSADTVEKLPTDHSTKEKTWFAKPQPIEILAP